MSIIRRANPNDLTSIFQFDKAYMAEIEGQDQLHRWLAANTSIKICRELAYHLSRTFVAEYDTDSGNVVIGHCYWSISDEKANIFSIYVREECRGGKVASNLLKCVEEDMKAAGFHGSYLQTLETNPARHFCTRRGFLNKESVPVDGFNYTSHIVSFSLPNKEVLLHFNHRKAAAVFLLPFNHPNEKVAI